MPRPSVEARFWAKVRKTRTCWLWMAGTVRGGYGQFRIGPKHIYAHRWLWEHEYGPIPMGQQVLHHCDNPPCIRPSHLFLGTQADNMLDAAAKGRQAQSSKTHCPAGHPYIGANLYVTPDGGNRRCRTCRRDQQRARRWENKAA